MHLMTWICLIFGFRFVITDALFWYINSDVYLFDLWICWWIFFTIGSVWNMFDIWFSNHQRRFVRSPDLYALTWISEFSRFLCLWISLNYSRWNYSRWRLTWICSIFGLVITDAHSFDLQNLMFRFIIIDVNLLENILDFLIFQKIPIQIFIYKTIDANWFNLWIFAAIRCWTYLSLSTV